MSSLNTSITEAMIIRQNTVIFVRVWSYLMIIFGTVGHILNVYILTRRSLRSNSCSWYFLAATISGFCVVTITTPFRLLSIGYAIDYFSSSLAACRFLTFIIMWARAQYAWFIALACVDRFLCSSSSAKLRALSSTRFAAYSIPLAALIVGLTFSHMLANYELALPTYTCSPIRGIYQTFVGIWILIAYSIGPPTVMLYFGLRTVQHIRQSARRIGANHNPVLVENQQQRPKRTDRQLMQMMFAQCTIFILTASLPAIQSIYTSVRSNLSIDDLQSAKDSAYTYVSGFISITVPCLSFYLFTLSSKLFRSELIKVFLRKQENRQTSGVGINLSRRN